MTYNPNLFSLNQVKGGSALDVTMTLDQSFLDTAAGLDTRVPVSAMSIIDGYTVGGNGELSLNPTTATASYSLYEEGAVNSTTALFVGDYVEAYYDGVLAFNGIVREIEVEVSPDTAAEKRGKSFRKNITYTLSSLDHILLSQVASWDFLPEESALVRLSRWFSIDYSAVAVAHRDRLATLVPESDAGTSTLIDLIRAFSAATLIPIRLATYKGPYFLEAFDTSQVWPDQPLVPVMGFSSAADWATSVTFTEQANGVRLPTGLSVKGGDMRLLGGIASVGVDPANLDDDFVLDSSRLDGLTTLPVGFRAPMPIEAFGYVLPVLKVNQSFGDVYRASVEIDPGAGASVAPLVVPTPDPTQDDPDPVVVIDPTAPLLPNGDSASVFDGDGDFLEAIDSNIFSISNTGNFSWEAWIRPDTLEFARTEQSGYVHFMGKGVQSQHEWTARMYSRTNTEVPPRPNRISAYAYNLAGSLGAGAYFEDALKAGEWIHVVATYNTTADRIRIYRDGVLRNESTFSSYSVVPANGTAPLRIGTRDGNSFFKGAIGKVAIYNTEIGSTEIDAHYRAMVSSAAGYDSLVMGHTPVAYWTLGTDLSERMGTGRFMTKSRAIYGGYNILTSTSPYGVLLRNGASTVLTVDQTGETTVAGKIASGATGVSSSAQVTAANPTAGHSAFHGQVADAAGNLIRGLVAGDATHRVILGMSKLSFGSGATSADTNLYRNGSGVLKTDGALQIAGDASAANLTASNTINGPTAYVTDAYATGRVYLGPSSDASIYRGSGPSLRASGPMMPGTYTTATRPSASSVPAGAMIYDVTISRPIFSDGTTWRNFAGTAV